MKLSVHTFALAAASLALVSALLTLHGAEPAAAQAGPPEGAGLVIFDGTAGPYRMLVTQSPERVIVGTVRVVIEPVDAETGEPVENALIRVLATPPGDGERQVTPALNSPTDRTLYFGQFQLEESGTWTIDVEIDGQSGRALAITQMTVHERARSGSNTLIGAVLFFLISAAFVGAGTWLWFTSRKARRRRNAIRDSGGTPRRSSG